MNSEMPRLLEGTPTLGGKRKRRIVSSSMSRKRLFTQHSKLEESKSEIKEEISLIEQQISGSRQHYNKIQTLLRYASGNDYPLIVQSQAWSALCGIFSVLLAAGKMTRLEDKDLEGKECVVRNWLIDRYQDYLRILLLALATFGQEEKSLALQLLMQVSKEECSCLSHEESQWMQGTFSRTLNALLETDLAGQQRLDFVRIYVLPYKDVRFYTFRILR